MNSWIVIFLLDKKQPSKIVLLKRASTKKFAPNMYTGIGGKVEKGETLLDSAYRELKEESGITDVTLEHFAKVRIDNTDELHYFFGIYEEKTLPTSEDGTLEWTAVDQIVNKDIIPTTLEMLKKWKTQNFSTEYFEIYLETISEENGIKQVKVL